MARFGSSTESDLKSVLKDKNAPNTDCSTVNSWGVFTAYLEAKSVNMDLETCSKEELNEILGGGGGYGGEAYNKTIITYGVLFNMTIYSPREVNIKLGRGGLV